jgi:hypothetical protein
MDRDKISKLYRGPSIDASYEVSVWLRGFRGEDKNVFEKNKIICT